MAGCSGGLYKIPLLKRRGNVDLKISQVFLDDIDGSDIRIVLRDDARQFVQNSRSRFGIYQHADVFFDSRQPTPGDLKKSCIVCKEFAKCS